MADDLLPADTGTPPAQPAYAVTAAWLCDTLGVDPGRGLDADQVARRRAAFGANVIGTALAVSPWRILLDQFRGAVVWLLFAAAALAFWMGDMPEAVAIAAVLVINGAIGFVTESRAVKSMEELRKLTHSMARVRRGGREIRLDAERLVPGDIILFDAGDVVPADVRLIEAADLNADESTLTGELVPVAKSTGKIRGHVALADRANMVFRGTSITRGTGVGITVATGHRTQLGEISELVAGAESESTPLEHRLDQLGRHLAFAALAISALIALIGFLGGRPLVEMVETAIALAVAAVPEGLPIVATLALARGMWRMAARNVLINRLSAVETLGSANVLMTDKTGTLTENRMTVAELRFADGAAVPGEGGDGGARLEAVMRVMTLCNDAALGATAEADLGDPMEIALLRAVIAFGGDPAAIVAAAPEETKLAFDPDTKLMATVNRIGDALRAEIKGAPESVLAIAASVMLADGPVPMTPERRTVLDAMSDEAAAMGLRMLGVAERTLAGPGDDPYDGPVFLGFIGLLDPARGDVPAAIAECRSAGVRVVMVTGDHKVTARKIAHDVGLIDRADGTVHEATEIAAAVDDAAAERELLACNVFARVPPRAKLDLVALHQRAGAVVAMTGDGVNDAPALRKADIGIAMGQRGTQVAAEASDVILRDDAFGSIVHAIREGRIIYGNIRAFIRYLFTCNLSEILLIAIATASGLPMPLLPLQILFLNLITDIFPAIALGFGEGTRKEMARPPRRKSEPLITGRGWIAIVVDGTLLSLSSLGAFVWALETQTPRAATGIAFLTICLAQLVYVFALYRRGESLVASQVTRNPYVWIAVALSTVITLAGLFVPPLSAVLQLTPPDAEGLLVVAIAAVVPTALIALGRTATGWIGTDSLRGD